MNDDAYVELLAEMVRKNVRNSGVSDDDGAWSTYTQSELLLGALYLTGLIFSRVLFIFFEIQMYNQLCVDDKKTHYALDKLR